MPRLVMKFGGTSVADLDRIRNAAMKVRREVERGFDVAVVVSAMAGKTNELVGWVDRTAQFYDAREYDAVVASGENVTAGLMALTLQEMGVPARSWQGWQVPMLTNSSHGAARIMEIDTTRLVQKFGEGLHAVIAGFQGVSPEGRITTLGRGGSDTSAVAFAAALEAERCDIYTDVDGVYTTDPRITKKARKLAKISYEEMLELASLGAKVLQTRSVELAMRYKVRLQVLSSFDDLPGTLVCDEEEVLESRVVSGIAHSRDEAKLTVLGVPDRPDWVSIVRILAILTDRGAPENRAVLHDAARPWGQVLCDGGDPRWRGEPHDRPLLSEQRLAQLLAARGNARRVLMTRAARAVAARHGPGLQANVADIAWSILAPDNAAILAKPYYRRFDGAGRGPETETDPHA